MTSKNYILGINCVYHEPSAALLKNGEIIAAVEEERFNRKKHGKSSLIDNPHELPYSAIDYCLNTAGIDFKDISHVGFSFNPIQRLSRNIGIENNVIEGDWGSPAGERTYYNLLMTVQEILETKYDTNLAGKLHWVPHHISHASSAYYAAPFDKAAVMTIDGIGEFSSILLAYGREDTLAVIEEVGNYPSSIGFLWTKASRYLSILIDGMGEYGAGKLMALASYGNPDRFYPIFRSFVKYDDEGNFEVDAEILEFRVDNHEKYERLFGFKPRKEGEAITEDHMDFAAALQKITNEIALSLANKLYSKTKSKNLVMAGGVTLNCTMNSYILENGPFEDIYVQPAANDMGTALGAAMYIHHQIAGNLKKTFMQTPYLGNDFSSQEIKEALESASGIEYTSCGNIESVVADLINKGSIIGWFQGRMEFGPRALGNRSFLADPRRTDIHKRLSQEIKGREWFRPLAPAILENYVDDWFIRPKGGAESDKWMLFSYEIKPDKMGLLPATTHYDDTARVQVVSDKTNPRFYKLIHEFYKLTGVPVVVNTSFNIKEPIVCTPEEAISTFIKSGQNGIDFLVIGDYLVVRENTFDLGLITKLSLPIKTISEHLR